MSHPKDDHEDRLHRRLKELVEAGVTKHVSDFTDAAKDVIRELTDEEHHAVLSMRPKIPDGPRHEFDHFVTLFF